MRLHELTDVRFGIGLAAYAFAFLFLFVCIGAAIHRLRTGRFSSGIHIVPTMFAFVGSTLGRVPWKLFFFVIVVDIGLLFFKPRPSQSEPRDSNGPDGIKTDGGEGT